MFKRVQTNDAYDFIDDEGNEFSIGSMVVEGEYLTLDGKSRRTSGQIFVDYRPGYMVYRFKN